MSVNTTNASVTVQHVDVHLAPKASGAHLSEPSLSINQVSEIASAAIPRTPPLIDDDDSKENFEKPFPFQVKTLPPFDGNQGEWLKKTGLTLEEYFPIDKCVVKNKTEWADLPEGMVLRLPKEGTGLPRTIVVFKAFDRLCVQVLCKTKGGILQVGLGAFKKGKIAVEWISHTLWVQYVTTRYERVRKGLEVHDLVAGKPGIFPKTCGRRLYQGKNGCEKFCFFGPYRDGAWNYFNTFFYKDQKHFIAHQYLRALCVLEEANIIHLDLRDPNILNIVDSNQKLQIEVNDFDLASIVPTDLAKFRNRKQTIPDNEMLHDLASIFLFMKDLGFDDGFTQVIRTQSIQKTLELFEKQFADQFK